MIGKHVNPWKKWPRMGFQSKRKQNNKGETGVPCAGTPALCLNRSEKKDEKVLLGHDERKMICEAKRKTKPGRINNSLPPPPGPAQQAVPTQQVTRPSWQVPSDMAMSSDG